MRLYRYLSCWWLFGIVILVCVFTTTGCDDETLGPSNRVKIDTSTLPVAIEGSTYSATIQCSGGNRPYKWTSSGLPGGLGIDTDEGRISGTPSYGTSNNSPYSVTVTVTDASSPKTCDTEEFTLIVNTTSGVPATVTYSGADFTIKDASGTTIGTGSVATTSSPYWPSNEYDIRGYAIGNVDDDPELEVVLIARHFMYYPGQVVAVEADGSIISRYWNPGHVYCLILHNIDTDGVNEILVGATNNDRVGGNFWVPTVFALDARTMTGEAPPRLGTIGSGTEIWYTFLNDSVKEGISQLTVSSDTLICESGGGNTYKVRLSDGEPF